VNGTPVDPNVQEIARRTEHVQGWLLPHAALHLYHLCRNVASEHVAVELGSWRGLSTAYMAGGMRDGHGGKLVAVDTWAGTVNEPIHEAMLAGYGKDQLYEEFLANMRQAGVDAHIEPLRMTTREAALSWKRGCCISVLHIDAGHDYGDVREDFELWSPFVVDGGYIVFDDVPSWLGPTRVVSELPRWYRASVVTPNKLTFQKRLRG
jgi:predicted O-methyltransferase YrrM